MRRTKSSERTFDVGCRRWANLRISQEPCAFTRPTGSILVVVLLITFVVGVLGVSMMTRTIRSARTGAWSRDHLVLRLLAESAVEELWVHLQEGANLPGDKTFQTLRTLREGTLSEPYSLPWLKPDSTTTECRTYEKELSGKIVLDPGPGGRSFVRVTRAVPVSPDPNERAGIVQFDIRLTLASARAVVTERVSISRAFSVVNAAVPPLPRLPGPTGTFSLFIGTSERETLPNFCATGASTGPPVFVPASNGHCTRTDSSYQTLLSALTQRFPDGLTAVPKSMTSSVQKSLELFAPASLSSRAQFVTTSAAQLQELFQHQFGESMSSPMNCVVYNTSTDVLSIDLSTMPFRGRCLIATAGPMQVFDVVLADPKEDSLTLVSPAAIVVKGRSVQASLVCYGPQAQGVIFAQKATVLGPIVSAKFPVGVGLSSMELGQCQIGANPSLDSVTTSGSTISSQAANYVAVFAPTPGFMEHRRD